MSRGSNGDGAYDRVTRSHGEIERWIRQRGGRPAAVSTADGTAEALAVRFPESGDERLVAIEWDEFFDRIEAGGVAFAYETDPDPDDRASSYRFVDRERAEAILAEGGTSSVEAERNEANERADERAARRERDRDAAEREHEAREQENVDSHRDGPPFES